MRRSKTFTEPALLAGLWTLLQVQYVRTQVSDEDLQRYASLASLHPEPDLIAQMCRDEWAGC